MPNLISVRNYQFLESDDSGKDSSIEQARAYFINEKGITNSINEPGIKLYYQ
jgi:hypothetical protein